MIPAAIFLGALALILAVPVPILLARASWPARAPGVALLLWQAVALAGGMSMIGALVVLGLAPFGSDIGAASTGLWRAVSAREAIELSRAWPVIALGAALLLGAHLVLNLALTIVASERERRRHRAIVTLLSAPLEQRRDARVIEASVPAAYCLPPVGGLSVTVLTAGLVALLDERELGAVIAHERAHLHQRHHLVTTAFTAWKLSLPWLPIASRAQAAVAMLVEMLADDRARSVADDRTLARAIVLVASGDTGGAPSREIEAPSGHAPTGITARVTRLADPRLPRGASAAVILLAIGLLAVPTALLAAPLLA